MNEMKKLDPGAKGWHIVDHHWHYFTMGKSFCGAHGLTFEASNLLHLGPRRVSECKSCLAAVNKRKL